MPHPVYQCAEDPSDEITLHLWSKWWSIVCQHCWLDARMGIRLVISFCRATCVWPANPSILGNGQWNAMYVMIGSFSNLYASDSLATYGAIKICFDWLSFWLILWRCVISCECDDRLPVVNSDEVMTTSQHSTFLSSLKSFSTTIKVCNAASCFSW